MFNLVQSYSMSIREYRKKISEINHSFRTQYHTITIVTLSFRVLLWQLVKSSEEKNIPWPYWIKQRRYPVVSF